MSSPAKLGLFVPLTAKASEVSAVREFLLQGYTLVQDEHEPETLQWFAIQYDTPLQDPSKSLSTQFLIFDTFAAESGRQAHLNGTVAAALMGKREALLAPGDEGVAIKPVELLQHKVVKPAGAAGVTQGLNVGLRVLFTAKADKVDQAKEHIINVGTKILGEATPNVWFGFRFPDTNQFGIIGLFTSDEERTTRLESQAATEMRVNAQNLFEVPPDVVRVNAVASKI